MNFCPVDKSAFFVGGGRGILNLIHKFASKFMCGISLDLLPLLKHKSTTFCGAFVFWRRQRDSNPRGVAPKRFSRPPRYDRFDMPPY